MRELPPNPVVHSLSELDQIIHAPARLMVLSYLYVVENADYVFLMRQAGLTWGNLASHVNKLEEAGYVMVQKKFTGKKPHSTLRLTETGRTAFSMYKKKMKQVLDDLPE